eukprot:gene10968-17081_t
MNIGRLPADLVPLQKGNLLPWSVQMQRHITVCGYDATLRNHHLGLRPKSWTNKQTPGSALAIEVLPGPSGATVPSNNPPHPDNVPLLPMRRLPPQAEAFLFAFCDVATQMREFNIIGSSAAGQFPHDPADAYATDEEPSDDYDQAAGQDRPRQRDHDPEQSMFTATGAFDAGGSTAGGSAPRSPMARLSSRSPPPRKPMELPSRHTLALQKAVLATRKPRTRAASPVHDPPVAAASHLNVDEVTSSAAELGILNPIFSAYKPYLDAPLPQASATVHRSPETVSVAHAPTFAELMRAQGLSKIPPYQQPAPVRAPPATLPVPQARIRTRASGPLPPRGGPLFDIPAAGDIVPPVESGDSGSQPDPPGSPPPPPFVIAPAPMPYPPSPAFDLGHNPYYETPFAAKSSGNAGFREERSYAPTVDETLYGRYSYEASVAAGVATRLFNEVGGIVREHLGPVAFGLRYPERGGGMGGPKAREARRARNSEFAAVPYVRNPAKPDFASLVHDGEMMVYHFDHARTLDHQRVKDAGLAAKYFLDVQNNLDDLEAARLHAIAPAPVHPDLLGVDGRCAHSLEQQDRIVLLVMLSAMSQSYREFYEDYESPARIFAHIKEMESDKLQGRVRVLREKLRTVRQEPEERVQEFFYRVRAICVTLERAIDPVSEEIGMGHILNGISNPQLDSAKKEWGIKRLRGDVLEFYEMMDSFHELERVMLLLSPSAPPTAPALAAQMHQQRQREKPIRRRAVRAGRSAELKVGGKNEVPANKEILPLADRQLPGQFPTDRGAVGYFEKSDKAAVPLPTSPLAEPCTSANPGDTNRVVPHVGKAASICSTADGGYTDFDDLGDTGYGWGVPVEPGDTTGTVEPLEGTVTLCPGINGTVILVAVSVY